MFLRGIEKGNEIAMQVFWFCIRISPEDDWERIPIQTLIFDNFSEMTKIPDIAIRVFWTKQSIITMEMIY